MPLLSCICALNFPIGDTAEALGRSARSRSSRSPGRKSRVGHCPSVLEYQGSTVDSSRWIIIIVAVRARFRSRCSAPTTRSEMEDQLSLIRGNATVNTASERTKDGPRQSPFNSPAGCPTPVSAGQTGKDGYPKRVVRSAANTTWYLGSSRLTSPIAAPASPF
jgi:hypothetical protein